jgi:hypothetical protein
VNDPRSHSCEYVIGLQPSRDTNIVPRRSFWVPRLIPGHPLFQAHLSHHTIYVPSSHCNSLLSGSLASLEPSYLASLHRYLLSVKYHSLQISLPPRAATSVFNCIIKPIGLFSGFLHQDYRLPLSQVQTSSASLQLLTASGS